MKLQAELLKHQYNFVMDVQTRFMALVGGYGCGKTHALAYKAIYLAMLNVGHLGLVLSPIHSMNKDNVIPKFDEVLREMGIPYTYTATPHPKFILHFAFGSTPILFHAAENYSRIAGLNLAWFICDEVDTTEHMLMHRVWKMLVSRLRAIGAPHPQGCCVSTPEGFKFLYDFFEKDVKRQPKLIKSRKLVRASTYDNPYLDAEYIQSMMESYPPNLITAYLHGQFVNLNEHSVYVNFDRKYNSTNKTVKDFDLTDDILANLHIGMDFNVGKCTAIVHCIKDDIVYAVDEFSGIKNTEAMIAAIQKRYPDRRIYIYPDASGDNESTNASSTDIELLKAAKFIVKARKKNPRVVNRVNSMNAMFLNAVGNRRYFINTDKCPVYVEALETQAYGKDGKPDKTHDQDHPNDAGGYFIYYKWPIKIKQKRLKLAGI